MADRRHFPPPWTIEDNGACYIVKDKNGQALAFALLLRRSWPAVGGYFVVERKQAGDHLLPWAFSRAHDTVMPRTN
jgi:hypothetical protein